MSASDREHLKIFAGTAGKAIAQRMCERLGLPMGEATTSYFPDGEVFDSSVDRGEPARFPLNRVIPCWTEAVQQMEVGGKAQLVCPPESAYGAQGAGPIPPNSTLHFDVELLGIQ